MLKNSHNASRKTVQKKYMLVIYETSVYIIHCFIRLTEQGIYSNLNCYNKNINIVYLITFLHIKI